MTQRLALLLAGLLCTACGDSASSGPTLDLPPRPANASDGSEIVRDLRSLDFEAREERIYAEVARGNVPPWLRRLRRVEITRDVGGHRRRLTFWAMPDYLAVGSESEYFFVPLSPWTALRVGELVGGSLPTPRMVDAIWESARARVVPIRIRPDEHMRTMRYFERHDRLVQAQRRRRADPGVFVAGHKLDVVLAAPVTDSALVALYGWHLSDGTPIQPLHRVPLDTEPHFSMGVRLVHRRILIDGTEADLLDVLDDPELAPLLWGTTSRAPR